MSPYCPTAEIDNTMNIEPIALYQVSCEANDLGYISLVRSIFIGFDPSEAGSLSVYYDMQKVRREMSEFTQFLATIPSQGSFQI